MENIEAELITLIAGIAIVIFRKTFTRRILDVQGDIFNKKFDEKFVSDWTKVVLIMGIVLIIASTLNLLKIANN